MANIRQPRHGSMQFWHRKRARSERTRVRYWNESKNVLPLGFAGYKVAMTHVMLVDNRKTTPTKGETVAMPVTIVECPPLKVFGLRVYKNSYQSIIAAMDVISDTLDKQLSRAIELPKKGKYAEKLASVEKDLDNYSNVTLLAHTQPYLCGFGKKKPEIFELAVGGKNIKEKFAFIKDHIGKDLHVDQVFKEGQQVDIHAVTKGKGYQGPVKRFGVPIRGHKSEKTKRGPGSLGAWNAQAHMTYRVAHAGQMGYHTRTEYNKWLVKITKNGPELNPKSGFKYYGIIRNPVVLIKGSVAGPAKRLIRFNQATRKNTWLPEEAPTVEQVCVSNIS